MCMLREVFKTEDLVQNLDEGHPQHCTWEPVKQSHWHVNSKHIGSLADNANLK